MRSIVALIVVFALFVGAVSARSVKRDRLGTAECDICTWVVTQAESLLASNNTEQEIITTLDSVCDVEIDDSFSKTKVFFYLGMLHLWPIQLRVPVSRCHLCTSGYLSP